MRSRTLPRSLRTTAATIVLGAATVIVIGAITWRAPISLVIAAVIALLAGFTVMALLSDEIRLLRRRWARDRVVQARRAAQAHRRQLVAEASFREAVTGRLRANRIEIEQLRNDVLAGRAAVESLEERLAVEQELTSLFGLRPEIDPKVVTPPRNLEAETRIDHLRLA